MHVELSPQKYIVKLWRKKCPRLAVFLFFYRYSYHESAKSYFLNDISDLIGPESDCTRFLEDFSSTQELDWLGVWLVRIKESIRCEHIARERFSNPRKIELRGDSPYEHFLQIYFGLYERDKPHHTFQSPKSLPLPHETISLCTDSHRTAILPFPILFGIRIGFSMHELCASVKDEIADRKTLSKSFLERQQSTLHSISFLESLNFLRLARTSVCHMIEISVFIYVFPGWMPA